MIDNIHTVTAQSPMSGMPAYGPSFGPFGARAAVPAAGSVQVSTCVRVRHIGELGLTTKDDFPGIPAWRPPTC